MENVPKETERIANKRNIRIAERLKAARAGIASKRAWWSDGPSEILGLVFIFAVNFIIILPFFGKASPEVSFSGPIVPLLSKAVTLFGVPFAYAVQIINISFFLLFPITFYHFVKTASGRKFPGFLAACLASLPVALFAKTRVDYGISGVDPAFIDSLSVLPLALLAILKFLKEGEMVNLILSSVTGAVIALISPFGFFIFLITSFITAFSEFLLGTGRLKILRLFSVYFFSWCLCSFWYNPVFSFWMLTGPMGADFRVMLGKLLPVSLFALPVLACLGYLLFDRKPELQPLFLALFYSIVFGIIVLVKGGFMISSAERYLPVLGISLSFLFGIVFVRITENFAGRARGIFYDYGLKNIILAAVFLLLILSAYFNKGNLIPSEADVLGVWDGVTKGSIWIMNDAFAVKYAFFGYIISLGGICFLAYLYINYKRNKAAPNIHS